MLYHLFHAGPHRWVFFDTPQYQPTKLFVRDKSHFFSLLFFTFKNWQFACAHFIEEETKAVNIDLNGRKHSLPLQANKMALPYYP